MDYRERILELVKASPVQPTSLSKIINKDSLMASAMLSEMSSKGLLKISNLIQPDTYYFNKKQKSQYFCSTL